MATSILETLEFGAVREILADYCVSPLGKSLALGLKPTRRPSVARRMIGQVTELKAYLAGGGPFPMRKVGDAVGLIERALEMNRSVEPESLFLVSDLLSCAAALKSLLVKEKDRMPILWRRVSRMEDLSDLESDLNRTVDRRGKVLSSASEALFDVRMKKEALVHEVRSRAEALLGAPSVSRWLQEKNLRVRRDRFVLPVRARCGRRIKGVVHGYSASGGTIFVEPEELVEMQNRVEKLAVRENREISRILWEKTRELIDFLEPIRTIQRTVAWLDFTYGRALYSLDYRLAEPDLAGEPILHLRDARHPILLKLAVEAASGSAADKIEAAFRDVVPLTVNLGERFDVLVITGPNTGGKTVALKTVGLAALMAASGLHVPAAAGSRLPVYGAVLADIGDEQDIFQSLSTFSSHIKRIGRILERADSNSLVLLDEFGSGTDPQEGEALGKAILAELLERKAKVLVTTHLSRLKEFAFSNEGVENGCMEFDPDTLRPTFRLLIGMPGASNAIKVARRLGIPGPIIEEAGRSLSSRFEELGKLMDGIARARVRVEAELDRSRAETHRIEEMRREIEEARKEVAEKAARLQEEAEREIDEALRRARDGAFSILKGLKNLSDPYGETVRDLEAFLDGMVRRTSLSAKRRAFVETLKKGDLVYVPRFRGKCRVQRVKKKDETISVLYGNMMVDISFEEVMWPHWF